MKKAAAVDTTTQLWDINQAPPFRHLDQFRYATEMTFYVTINKNLLRYITEPGILSVIRTD